MICQTTGHSGSDKDFSFARLRFGQPSAQFMMRPAKVVGAAHQPHPGFEHAHAARRVSAPPCQAGETLSHRPIEAFDKGGVQLLSPERFDQHLVRSLKGSLRHPPHHFDDALFRRFLDHRSNQDFWPRLERTPPAPARFLDLFAKRPANTARIRRPPIGQDQDRTQRKAAGFDHPQQLIRQLTIPPQTDHPSQPQARRNHHGHRHPRDHPRAFRPDLIGLDVLQIQLGLHHLICMDLLAVRARSFLPSGYGSFV